MSQTKILLLGGHGRIALKMTPLFLAQSWHVTSVIRDPKQESELQKLAKDQPGDLDVVIESLDEVKTEADAAKVLDRVKPQWVVWAAGAGGKGGAARTYAVDQDAAKAYISASAAATSVRKFLMISHIGSRRGSPPWWTEEDRKASDHVNTTVLADYYKAKLEADEHLLAVTEKKRREGKGEWQMINLRPGALTDDDATGKVKLGKVSARGKANRDNVAAVAVALLSREDTRGYFDMVNGEDGIAEAVEKLVKEGHDGTEGEDLDQIHKRI